MPPFRRMVRRTTRRTIRRQNLLYGTGAPASNDAGYAPAPEPTNTPAPAPAPAPSSSMADELAKLSSLRDQGIISDADFEAGKAKLLGM